MAKKKEESFEERILPAEYSEVMQKSYIDYSMSVIVARALPDARDGLKPVQRRILFDMDELGTASDKPYRKCARIVGDTMGKYHPHGDSSIYGALVTMAQEFKQGMPLTDGHGNFGSIEGDGAAAMRYTEARLQKFTEAAFLSELKNDTVDFMPNFDETEKEPVVLPCKVPNLLINGSEGIAVGMATNIPPHNVDDVIDTAIHYLDHPDATNAQLLEILKGPDFPTGGIVSNKSDLLEIYSNGSGKIKVRGRITLEENKTGRDKLVVTEIPYTMIGDGISKFLQSVADLVENRTLPDIVDISNQSSKEGIRIVFELRKGADAEYIKNVLLKKTRLEDTFGLNLLAVDHGRPSTMSLADVMRSFSEFQYEIYTRKFTRLLARAEEKKEIDEGLIMAVDCIDLIIEILRGSKNLKQAKDCMVHGITDGIRFRYKGSEIDAKELRFTEKQADAILNLRLQRLIGLEIDALRRDYDDICKAIKRYQRLLGSKAEMRKEIKKELIKIKEEFHQPRRTEIIDAEAIVIQAPEEKEAPVTVLIDRFGYAHCVDQSVYEKNKEAADGDYRYVVQTTSKSKILAFVDTGKLHSIKVQDIPLGKLRDKGQPLDNICNYDSARENVVNILPLDPDGQLVFVASDSMIKRVNASEFDVSRKTIDATKLNPEASLTAVFPYLEKGQLIFGTRLGVFARIKQAVIPEKKKTAIGVIGIAMNKLDSLQLAMPAVSLEEELPIGDKKIPVREIKPVTRGGKGKKMEGQLSLDLK